MRLSFVLKVIIIVAIVATFDRLFPDRVSGARIGIFAMVALLAVTLGRRDVRHNRRTWIALVAATLFALVLVDDPGPLPIALFWCALAMAALLPKTARFDSAWHWAARLALHATAGLAKPIADLKRTGRHRRGARVSPGVIAATLGLPLAGGALFLALFAAANPLIAQALAAIRLPTFWQVLTWLIVAWCLWPALRPSSTPIRIAAQLADPEPTLPGTSLPSVLIALALFNAIFAVQNGLDIAFLWSGGALPASMTQTEYVHRGAYPLIGTALIAGVMALAMLRPGSASERNPWARRLVTLWVAQNLVLVASSVLRTLDYIQASMLTAWRIAALAWMALVALGLVLICWRILKGRSARWLINWNALAATLVLTVCSFIDLGAVAAAWNVHRQAPSEIDLCYLHEVGAGALLPLIELERRPLDAATRDRVRYVRERLLTDLEAQQGSWSDWTPRGARRLTRAHALIGAHPAQPQAVAQPAGRACDGSIQQPPVTTSQP